MIQHVNNTKSQVTIGLMDPKGPTNVGAVMRAAGCYSVNKVLYTGTRYTRASQFITDTKRAAQHIPLLAVDDLVIEKTAEQKVICVDLVEGAIPLPEFVHPDNALYIFGPEDGTISQQVINQADAVVYVPTTGCMNLAASVNVLLYDRLAKDPLRKQGNELIKASRDTNNKVKVIKKLEEYAV